MTVTLRGPLPVRLLATGDVTIAGTLDASGADGLVAETLHTNATLPLIEGGAAGAGGGAGGDSSTGAAYGLPGGNGESIEGGGGGGGGGDEPAPTNYVAYPGGGGGAGHRLPGIPGGAGGLTYAGYQGTGGAGRGGWIHLEDGDGEVEGTGAATFRSEFTTGTFAPLVRAGDPPTVHRSTWFSLGVVHPLFRPPVPPRLTTGPPWTSRERP